MTAGLAAFFGVALGGKTQLTHCYVIAYFVTVFVLQATYWCLSCTLTDFVIYCCRIIICAGGVAQIRHAIL